MEYVQGFSGAPYMFPTESECHSDYELIKTLICLPAITPFFNPSSCMKTQANYFPAGKSNIFNCNMKTVGFFFSFPLFSFVNLQIFLVCLNFRDDGDDAVTVCFPRRVRVTLLYMVHCTPSLFLWF